MIFSVKVFTPPAEEPVAVDEARQHLRLETDEVQEDQDLKAKISAARAMAERFTRRAFVTQTLDLFLPRFPGQSRADFVGCRRIVDIWYGNAPRTDAIMLPFTPAATVTWVKYVDEAGVWQTLDAAQYFTDVNGEPGSIRLKPGNSWPATLDVPSAVNVRFSCGYGGASAVPADLKMALLLIIGHLYENRESQEMPPEAANLLTPFIVF